MSSIFGLCKWALVPGWAAKLPPIQPANGLSGTSTCQTRSSSKLISRMPSTASIGRGCLEKLGVLSLASLAGWIGATGHHQSFTLETTPFRPPKVSNTEILLALSCFQPLCNQLCDVQRNTPWSIVELCFSYLDDAVLVGQAASVASALAALQAEGRRVPGSSLNLPNVS